ncbi:MAG TPA: NAD+ synthase [Gammaproteobacteria bacterium]|nr:NAD+ synthase [Gammaproteobacteria bacterium]
MTGFESQSDHPVSTGASLKIALAQHDCLVGDLQGNADKILQWVVRARDELGADIILFPELNLTGYPPEDLLLRHGFIADTRKVLDELCRHVHGITAIIGCPMQEEDCLYNSAVIIKDGVQIARYDKQSLPNFGVFDEKRYFTAGGSPCIVETYAGKIGVTICEDIWQDGPARQAVQAGAKLILNLNASPYHMDKRAERIAVVAEQARLNSVPVVYVNMVGGQDELVFDGGSFVVDASGARVLQAPVFLEDLSLIEITCADKGLQPEPSVLVPDLPRIENVYRALVLGVRDYALKNGFKGAVIGLSGGIDSALTLAIASDALGAENVKAVLMPSRYTQSMSIEDAREQAGVLGVHHQTITIEPMFTAFLDGLKETFAAAAVDTTEENIQARCRGIILMAISNKQGRIVLTTGNKSEMAVGYATLYGDMAGGYAVIKDVPKMLVYELANWRNSQSQVIPQRVIDRPPSAELADDQKDEDSLPVYEILDAILEMYIEDDCGLEEIVAKGFDRNTVRKVLYLVDLNEYKRKQAAPGVRITKRAFGRDRRYPITSAYMRHVLKNDTH